jgi:hypothetical protein
VTLHHNVFAPALDSLVIMYSLLARNVMVVMIIVFLARDIMFLLARIIM